MVVIPFLNAIREKRTRSENYMHFCEGGLTFARAETFGPPHPDFQGSKAHARRTIGGPMIRDSHMVRMVTKLKLWFSGKGSKM